MGCCANRPKDCDSLLFDQECDYCQKVVLAERSLCYNKLQAKTVVEMYNKHTKHGYLSAKKLNAILSEFGVLKYDGSRPNLPVNEFYNQFQSGGRFEAHNLMIISLLLTSSKPSGKAIEVFSAYDKTNLNSLKIDQTKALFTELFDLSLSTVVLAETLENSEGLGFYKDRLKKAIPRTVTQLIELFIGNEGELTKKSFVNLITNHSEAGKVLSTRGLRNLLVKNCFSSVRPA